MFFVFGENSETEFTNILSNAFLTKSSLFVFFNNVAKSTLFFGFVISSDLVVFNNFVTSDFVTVSNFGNFFIN